MKSLVILLRYLDYRVGYAVSMMMLLIRLERLYLPVPKGCIRTCGYGMIDSYPSMKV